MSKYHVAAFAAVLAVMWGATMTPIAAQKTESDLPVSIAVDAGQVVGPLKPIWRYFGADEPNYATMKDGQKLLAELGELAPGQVHFRAHNLLTTGDGTPDLKWGSTNAYTEDANGNPIYNWTILDGIIQSYLDRGVKPYAQIGFMPEALSTNPKPYKHSWTPQAKYDEIYTGWTYPPKSYEKWEELVYQWTKHCVDKWGRAEVETWWWETWNEPNIGYWRGTPEEFQKLHDYAIAGVRRALPTARVGGPDVAGGGSPFLRDFLGHCVSGQNYATGEVGTPTDLVSFHAKGTPRFVDGHVRMGISNQLRDIDRGFADVAAVPKLKNTPIVIGESDPDGCAACQGAQLGYRNGTLYSSYTAASFARKHELADRHGVNLEGALTWAFEFENQPYFAGFRVLASNGLDLPVLNTFRMFSKMSGERVKVESSGAVPLDDILKSGVRQAADVSALTGLDVAKQRLSVMVWNYHDDDVLGPTANVDLTLSNLPVQNATARLHHYRIDETHSNSYTAWKALGSPQEPTPEQYRQLESAGKLGEIETPPTIKIENGKARLNFALPRQAVSLVTLEWM